MRRDLKGRIVLVTGASRGIGRRVATLLARRGCRLALTARSADELAQTAQQCQQLAISYGFGGEVLFVTGDLTLATDRERIVAEAILRYGGLDVLINAAGVCSFGEFSTSTPEILRRVMEVNFFAAVEMVRLAHPYLAYSACQGAQVGWRPAVVNVASICGRWGIPSMSEHCASKHALVGWSEAIRAEFVRYGIDVLLVLPGLVRSDDLQRHLLRNEGKIYLDFAGAPPPEQVARDVLRALRTRRRELASGWVSWGVWWSRRLFPRAVRFFMQRKVWRFARRERLLSRTS
ncbi:MAG: SDR family NAD(P)-dependent oxidoreductase [Gemmataceae bacterium]|nr:SDR family NAD(P)-dependent oxidoreductase [Gemmataceae bacterium]MCS7270547.1 SDR family NAD(P)-dependent oxidoreductase [Gemmataceae bacterium]MDW8242947.1 SDR family NAD(P)-dependent oxidoreductase [Thermogemmata sp.]